MSATWTVCRVLAARANGTSGAGWKSNPRPSMKASGKAPWSAARRNASPSQSHRVPWLASQSRVAFARMASNTGSRSLGELLIMPRTWEVAVSRSRDSLSSRRHASSSPWLLRHQIPSRLIKPCLIRSPRLGQSAENLHTHGRRTADARMAASLRLMRPCLGVAMPLLWGVFYTEPQQRWMGSLAAGGPPTEPDGASEFTAGSRDVAFWHGARILVDIEADL